MTRTLPTVQVLIQHHPSRVERAAQLVATLGAGTLVADPEPNGPRSAWRTYRACLEHPTSAPYRAIIQDDSIPLAPRLVDLLPRLCSPSQVSSLCCLGVPARAVRAVHEASDRGEHWADFPRGDWVCAIALIWPAHLAERFLAWVGDNPRLRQNADDGLIGNWLRRDSTAPLVRCSVPNLVQHPDDVPAIGSPTTRHRYGENPRRVSACVPEAGCDPFAVDWG